MKTLITFLLLAFSAACLGQKKYYSKNHLDESQTTASSAGITVTDEVRLNQLGLDRKIDLSKGEQFTEKEWQEYNKQMLPYVRQYFARDSTHKKFLQNTISPHLTQNDTLESWGIVGDQILLRLKPKKK